MPSTAKFQLNRLTLESSSHFDVRQNILCGIGRQVTAGKAFKEWLKPPSSERRQSTDDLVFFRRAAMEPLVHAEIEIIGCLDIELPDVFRFPRSERLRIYSLDIGVRHEAEHLEALRRLHNFGKRSNRLLIKNIATHCS